MATARLLSSTTHLVPRRLKVTELLFDVPFDHSAPFDAKARTIRLFGRAVEKSETPAAPAADEKPKNLPWMVYLQGGPGFGCGQPGDYGFTKLMLDRGYKVCSNFHLQIVVLYFSSVIFFQKDGIEETRFWICK